MMNPGLIDALTQIMTGLKYIGDGITYLISFFLNALGFPTTHTDGNNPDSSLRCLETGFQTHQFNILVLHHSTGYELPRFRLKKLPFF
jgi:hypothetical protein